MRPVARVTGAALVGLLAVGGSIPGGSASSAAVAPTTTIEAPGSTGPGTTLAPTTTRPVTTIPPATSTTTATPPTTTSTAEPGGPDAGPEDPPDDEATPAPGPPGVSLVSQSPWIPTGGSEVIALHLDEPALLAVPEAEVRLTIHNSVSSRTEFEDAISGASLGNVRNEISFPMSSLQVNARRNFLIGFGLSGSDAARRIGLESPGVYPVEIGVADSGIDRGTFLTWMVVVDPEVAADSQPLRFSWIWRLETPPLELAGGALNPAALPPLRPGGRLDHISTLLARAGNFPLNLGIGPEMLTGWNADARAHPAVAPAVARIRKAAQLDSTQLLPEPYVPISGPVIEAEGLGRHVPEEFVAGASAIEQMTGEIPDPRTAFVDPIDGATVTRLKQMLVGRFVVRDTALTPIPQDRTPAQPFTLTSEGISAPAFATDTALEQLIESPGPPALRAQRLIAALAEIAYEAPSQARGVVLSTPANWAPDVATITLLLRALAEMPLVQPATLDDLFSEVAPTAQDGVALERRLAPPAPLGELPLRSDEYDDAVRDLTAYRSMVGGDDASVSNGYHSLLLALSTANTREQALAHLRTISVNLDSLTGGITTTARALTLTARRASIPLSFQNNTRRPGIRVRVHLESPKLIFPDGPDYVFPLPIGHFTKRFAVEARASGTFAMTITLESPDGSIQLGPPTRVAIRSAVFSGIGLALTLGALLFLAGWWGNHFWRTRRARRIARAT